ncbi:MAG: double-strand break repair protein AddB, partial [Pseudomonadota bacterium]
MADGPDDIRGRVFSIPSGAGFLDTLAMAILKAEFGGAAGELLSQSELASVTILLPTRRAVRGLQESFLTASEKLGRTKAIVLPRLRPISEGDETASLLSGLAHDGPMAAGLDIQPAVSELERRVVLMRLIQNWSAAVRESAAQTSRDGAFPLALGAATPAQAAKLASELARFIDLVETERVPIEKIAELVPDTYSDHWQQTLNFLEIVVKSWPNYLTAAGLLSPADRRNQVMLA